MTVSNVQLPVQLPANPAAKSGAEEAAASKVSFGQWLTQSLGEVDRLQQTSDEAAQKLMTGQSRDIHGTMVAMQKANIALELTMEIRNKIISAYDEIKRMQF